MDNIIIKDLEYNEFDEKELQANVEGTEFAMDAVIAEIEQRFPEKVQDIELVIDINKMLIQRYKDYGAGQKSLEECEKIAQKNKEYLIKKYNAPETLKLPGLGIE